MAEPPRFSSREDLIIWMIATVFMTIATFVGKKLLDVRNPSAGAPAQSPERERIEEMGVDTDGLAEPLVKMLARYDERLTAVEKTNSRLLAENKALYSFVSEQTEHIDDLESGVLAGIYPPFKERPKFINSHLP